MTRRHTWQDERRVRRLAVLLCATAVDRLRDASALDKEADYAASEDPRWPTALKAAEHYLREIGRTKSDG